MKRIIKRLLFGYSHYRPSFSIAAEDIILHHILQDVRDGFYIDIGAYHPEKCSNTFYLYKMGWQGINIDAMPGVLELFNKQRQRDINLALAVSNEEGPANFYVSDANNLFNSLEQGFQQELYPAETQKISVVARRLESILDENLPPGRRIDLLLIDVEGHEHNVLLSNNWEKYRPRIILLEDFTTFVDELDESPCVGFLKSVGYRVLHKIPNGIIFSRNDNKFTAFNRLLDN